MVIVAQKKEPRRVPFLDPFVKPFNHIIRWVNDPYPQGRADFINFSPSVNSHAVRQDGPFYEVNDCRARAKSDRFYYHKDQHGDNRLTVLLNELDQNAG